MGKESMNFKKIWVHKHFFQSKMVLNILKGVKDVDKVEKDEVATDLEEKALTASTGPLVDHIKQIILL
jgi:hypothetical protein